jgi:hypothetical protein
METQDTYSERATLPDTAPSPSIVESDRGIVLRWRKRHAERKRSRLVSPRNRRALAQWLRRTAKDANGRRPTPRHDLLLHYRAAAVRTDLLEIAALLERAHDPDPACVAALHEMLASGDSPLYHPGVPAAELRATLDEVRAGLSRRV